MFRVLERASELRSGISARLNGRQPEEIVVSPPESGVAQVSGSLWVYVSTIGELNAIEPFLRPLLAVMGEPPLVLLTDHAHYRDSYLAKYPAARVRPIDHRSETAAILAAELPPRLLIVAEIPCGLSDAPCRFPFAVVYELKRRDIPVCLVNGWLYKQSPSCTMDAIEKRLFGTDYLRLIDLITVQDEPTRATLIAQGAEPAQVFVTGNIKYDAIDLSSWNPRRGKSPAVLESIATGGRPSIVAGCVTNIPEQILVLDAFAALLPQLPGALMVIAPRQPEVKERMQKLRELLEERKLSYAFKSQTGDVPVPRAWDCLVLDTMGELKDFYAAGDIAYVGLNHNLLEPLCFGKSVAVTAGWNPMYPSFPVYNHLLRENAIMQVEPNMLCETWLSLLSDPSRRSSRGKEIMAMLDAFKGAAARNIELMKRLGLLAHASH